MLSLWLGCFYSAAVKAQADYQGLRLAVFELKMGKENGGTFSLNCSVANTGRLPVELNGKGIPLFSLVVETDTLHLPAVLRDRPGLVQRALLREKFRLAPGEIRPGLTLSIRLQDTLPDPLAAPACADLMIDTAYLIQQNERTLSLQVRLRNAGTTAVRLTNLDKALVLNAYFVAGAKLTRGAIFAEQIPLPAPRELSEGLLPAGGSVSWSLEISAKNRTRFSPHLALEFDPLQALPDCGQNRRVWVIGN
ncbi:MAG: hypothetical protein ABIQ93_00430 [Saprospiraceae bacterium]